MLFFLAELEPHVPERLIEGAVGLRGVCRVPVRVPQSALKPKAHVRSEETTALCREGKSAPPRQLRQRWPLSVPRHTSHAHVPRYIRTLQRWHYFPGSCLCLRSFFKGRTSPALCQSIKQHNNNRSTPESNTMLIVSGARGRRGKVVFLAAGEQNIAAWHPEITPQSA